MTRDKIKLGDRVAIDGNDIVITNDPLTPRESEIALFVVMGRPAKRIAALLNLSVHTVEKHIENAAAKLPNPEKLPARGVIVAWMTRKAA